jgi:hypothetical protein
MKRDFQWLVLLLILAVVACKATNLPKSPAVSVVKPTATVDAAATQVAGSAQTIKREATEALKAVPEPFKVPVSLHTDLIINEAGTLEQVVMQLKMVAIQLKQVQEELTAKDDAYEALYQQDQTTQRKLTATQTELTEAKALYHDSWFGGRMWRLVYWVTGISAVLLIASLFLNAKTDIFVTIFEIIMKVVAWPFTFIAGWFKKKGE